MHERIVGGRESAEIFDGTYRTRSIIDSLQSADSVKKIVGISRVANITGLDVVGMPVWQAIRPMSWNLTVSQGKGLTSDAAKASAIFESIEMWHAECPDHDICAPISSMADSLGYDIYNLETTRDIRPYLKWPIAWKKAIRLHDAKETMVPLQSVTLDFREDLIGLSLFSTTSTGLASGNSFSEATFHAVLECVERGAIPDAATQTSRGKLIKLESILCLETQNYIQVAKEHNISCSLEFHDAAAGIPTFLARTADFTGLECCGSGSHISAPIAARRAVSEAFQSRLTVIAGSRDDIEDFAYSRSGINKAKNYEGSNFGDLIEPFPHSLSMDMCADVREIAKHLYDEGWYVIVCPIEKRKIGIPVVFVKLVRRKKHNNDR